MSLLDIISNTTSALSKNPNAAKATFDASHALVGVTEVSVRVGSGHKFTVDEPKVLGGKIMGPTQLNMHLLHSVHVRQLLIESGQPNLEFRLTKLKYL